MEQAVAQTREDGLRQRHQRLCATVSGALAELDELITAAEAQA